MPVVQQNFYCFLLGSLFGPWVCDHSDHYNRWVSAPTETGVWCWRGCPSHAAKGSASASSRQLVIHVWIMWLAKYSSITKTSSKNCFEIQCCDRFQLTRAHELSAFESLQAWVDFLWSMKSWTRYLEIRVIVQQQFSETILSSWFIYLIISPWHEDSISSSWVLLIDVWPNLVPHKTASDHP